MADTSKSSNLGDEAYRKLRHAIISGELAEGARLREEELASRLHLSRTPIREALFRLAGDGLVETSNGRSAVVKSITADEADALLDVWAVLTRHAVSLAAPRLTEVDVDTFAARVEAFEVLSGVDPSTARAMMEQAFELIYERAENPELVRMIDGLRPRLELIVEVHYPEGIHPSGNYRAVVDALRGHDHAKVLEIMDLMYGEIRRTLADRFRAAG